MDLVTREYGYNAFYGLNNIVNKAMGTKGVVRGHIEHGIGYSGVIDINSTRADVIYTASTTRKDFIESVLESNKVIAIGNYIKYASSIMTNEEIESYRKSFGKTLLVFPSHSTHHVITSFDEDALIAEIEKIRKEHCFYTVLVCEYWKNYLLGDAAPFEKKGYKICSAGHIYDPNFLSRLKAIISLADVTMGNSFGTHIGYCLGLGKPFYLYHVDVSVAYFDGIGEFSRNRIAQERFKKLQKETANILGTYREYITPEAEDYCEKYWGN